MFSNDRNSTIVANPVGMSLARPVTTQELEQITGGVRVTSQKLTGSGGSNGGQVEYTIDGTA
ncbi:MAG: hypothetical protein QM581_11925 [Pseudomonas sp.]